MDAAFDDVRFLAASSNRTRVLATLASGPSTRDELLEAIDASRVTLRRVLGELEDRGWVEREGGEYATTRTGGVIAGEFAGLLDALRATHRLDGAMEWLPREAFPFNIGRLADARVTLPGEDHVIAPVARVDTLIRRASRARIYSPGISTSTVAANRDAVVENGQHLELVLAERVVPLVRERPDLSAMLVEMLESEHTTAYAVDDDLPMMVAVLDGRVVLGLVGGGLPRGVVESEDETVHRWAVESVETRRANAAELSVATFDS